jgi:hypothetical protein
MTPTPEDQPIIDAEQLRMLRIAYLISAGISAFMALFGLLHVFIARVIQSDPGFGGEPEEARFAIRLLVVVGTVFFFFAIAGAVLRLYAARCLRLRNNHAFCQVVAGLSCVDVPYGTALGVITFNVLGRASVRDLFERREPPSAPAHDTGGI